MKKNKIISALLITLIIISCANNNVTNNKTFSPPEWSYNKSIYEVNIRQYTKEGTFAAFEDHLVELKDMGIGIIWLMPIHPIGEKKRKGTLGSYYSVKDYKGINPRFGTHKDFKNLVDKIHELGMYVIIDWVANHTSWDHKWTETNKNFYTLDSSGNFVPPVADWADVIDLNYENKELWPHMIDALEYWVNDFNIDGYRCDVAAMVPNEFWSDARKELETIKPVFMLAEAHEPAMHLNGFNMTYNWQLKDLMNNFALGKVEIEELKNHFLIDEKVYPENAFRMNFTTNHDENSWNGTVYERLGKLSEPFSILFSTVSGMPLVYSGQEAGMNKRLEFFEKDLIQWKDDQQKIIFSKIFTEKKKNKALWNGAQGGEMNFINVSSNKNVIAYYREKDDDKIIVIINLSEENSKIFVNENQLWDKYKNLLNDNSITIDKDFNLILGGYEYLVLVN